MNNRFHESASHNARGITRRTFLALGSAAALPFFLPCLRHDESGYAYAAGDGEPEFTVFAVTLNDIGISVVDVTGGTNKPKAGAFVTLSTSDGKSVSGTTSESGTLVLDIKTVAAEVDLGSRGTRLRFDGTITIDSGDGYRVCEIARIRADGGSGIQVPTRMLESANEPYFQQISFDGWDIQYTENQFFRSLSNSATHKLAGKVWMPGAKSAEVRLKSRDANGEVSSDPLATATVQVGDSSVGTFAFEKHFLNPVHGDVLPLDHEFLIELVIGETVYQIDTKLSVVDAAVDGQTSDLSSISPVVAESGLGFTLPAEWPDPFGGSKVSIWVPTLPVIFAIYPPSVYMLGVGTPSLEYKNGGAFMNADDWKTESSGSISQQLDELEKDMNDKYEKYQSMKTGLNPDGSAASKYSMSKSISLSVAGQAYALMEYDYKSDLWQGSLNFIIQASLGITFTFTFVVFSIPIFVQISPSMAAKLAAKVAMLSRSLNPRNYTFDYTRTGISFTYTIEIALTVGIGIAGVASVAARGAGYISFYLGLYEAATGGHELPHAAVGAGIEFDIVVQITLFKWSGKLWGIDNPRLFDSWDSSVGGVESSETPAGIQVNNPSVLALGTSESGAPMYSVENALASGGLDMDAFAQSATIVTERELALTAECTAVRSESYGLQDVRMSVPMAVEGSPGVYELSTTQLAGGEFADDGYDYTFIGTTPESVMGVSAGVAGIGSEGGVRPTLDKLVAKNVFSDPRSKIVTYRGGFVPVPHRVR